MPKLGEGGMQSHAMVLVQEETFFGRNEKQTLAQLDKCRMHLDSALDGLEMERYTSMFVNKISYRFLQSGSLASLCIT